ncbi:ABC-type branched-subunit amino acid transport system substrate-binding protein [Streptomyces sp. SAI-208]|uniref:ABC transporter substrate-binding protein n=1 Tax=unclassified Streptomyces TaxID=2593676 RepID=UPI0024752615|nr:MULTISPECIES: ABC transporter substrate-binding protein [unclassified Streptomyces]MDH6520107.1 ABC-type branched-subunit amino acid transport system substrate-binding protein [Streptomyces sp. SAI-090]MDH6552322.1 ABC-type branched-subunit amino acid transport system substrate-binding protein [Streptomyces sp. SAI-041]MDH6583627.1 ABC-type branched-subunit amino acid transport system substrate-binding protein [Streptomyces sp. SAI-133]MDH6611087.1 ABC-type branched-subunit amino acid transp
MPRRRRFRAAEAALAVLLLTTGTACGSRLPESDFEHRERTTPAQESTPIRVGIVTSATSPVGGSAFTGPRDGARAYFERLNARGGLGGRRVEVRECDDGGSGVGNNTCVHRLIDEDKVVALVATTALDYAGASRVSRARVPDIGGQPIGAAYDTWPHLYGIYGSLAPRDGTTGWDGKQYGGTEVYRYFKREHGARTAAVVSYNQAASAAYARLVEQGLRAEGYQVVTEQVDFALPNFRAVAADLKEQGADLVFDAVDSHGNAQLCEAMDAAGVEVTAKVTNVQNWTSTVPDDYRDAPRCRNALWATGSSRNFEDVGNAAVREFRDATKGLKTHSQWQLEGWAAAMWFTDAAKSCAPQGVTRACVDAFMNRSQDYTAHGLLVPVRFEHLADPPGSRRTCLSVARWQDGRGWVSQGDMNRTCFDVPQLPYRQ